MNTNTSNHEIGLGLILTSPKHGRGQIVDQRQTASGSFWIVLYDDGTFGSYRTERIRAGFKLHLFASLPSGYPKIALPPLKAEPLLPKQPEVGPQRQLDTRPYRVYFVDFFRRKLLKVETYKP